MSHQLHFLLRSNHELLITDRKHHLLIKRTQLDATPYPMFNKNQAA